MKTTKGNKRRFRKRDDKTGFKTGESELSYEHDGTAAENWHEYSAEQRAEPVLRADVLAGQRKKWKLEERARHHRANVMRKLREEQGRRASGTLLGMMSF